ncbi:hypothetical protein T440DRAFT_459039 [Plenodomus tracheiphilus IPT5]|uniref:Tyrosine specific protein phosphatases domain-containing protein n=1 Tax=Plenodomus tracheiphilus IPT5 TaxID=1408161 RepID=A0A6A7AVJ7_9PLEO|nr:hypothetical protein T440DRAFT_459039 [Plenodomus tracheiphilus IPT5]
MSHQQEQPPLPTPPFHSIPNLNNLRDVALSPLRTTTTNQTLRPGLLFRSAEVSHLDSTGWLALRALGVAKVFDLRSKPEVDKGWAGIVGPASGEGWLTTMESADITRTWTPVFEESDYSPERLAERYAKYMEESVQGFVHAYRDILESGGGAFKTILLYFANLDRNGQRQRGRKGAGALIHCTAGKDRTGIFFALLLSFLDIPDAQIADEYALTEQGLLHIREQVVARLLGTPGFVKYIAAQLEHDNAKGNGNGKKITAEDVLEKGRAAALRMIGAKRESMIGALGMLKQDFGGAEAYLRGVCGLGDEELEALRRNLLVGGGEGREGM